MSQNNPTGSTAQAGDSSATPPPLTGSEITGAKAKETPAKKDPPPPKLFSFKRDTARVVPVDITWEALYPGFEPWGFKFRLALSAEMQKKREEWLALPQGQAEERARFRQEVLDEICDLLTDNPTGFEGLNHEQYGPLTQDPGSRFRNFVTAIERDGDPDMVETLYKIIIAADNGYWAKVMPREFRPKIPNSGS